MPLVTSITFPEEDLAHEVRRHIRYPLRASVHFEWIDPEGKQGRAKGNSRDISEGGAYVVTRACPPVGAHVYLVFRFPYLEGVPRLLQLEMNGQVVRAESVPGTKASTGFAVVSIWAILQEPDPDGESQSSD
jgi:hypothetical protein